MSKHFYPIILVFVALGFNACNKNSNELPPRQDNAYRISDLVTMNGLQVLRLQYVQNLFPLTDSVYVQAFPDSNQIKVPLTLFVEYCNGAVANYKNCNHLDTARVIPTKPPGDTILRYYNQRINLGATGGKFTAGILSAGDAGFLFRGVYASIQSNAQFFQDTAYKYSGFARAYVLADGSITIRLYVADTAQYNITGVLNAQYALTGNLTKDNTLITPVNADVINANIANMMAGAGQVQDTIRLYHSLPDNVNKIFISLKK